LWQSTEKEKEKEKEFDKLGVPDFLKFLQVFSYESKVSESRLWVVWRRELERRPKQTVKRHYVYIEC
jgi:hypothetical protein